MQNLRVLIDTNIFIALEGESILEQSYSELIRTLEHNNSEVLVHSASRKALQQPHPCREYRRAGRLS